jgi:glycosyltransferase involved in cell wall biosynthesis
MPFKKTKIIAHCLVKNEERFVWYSIQSILPYVDKVMVWDTGSTDNTVEIIKTIKSPKISFKEVGSVTPENFPKVRQEMIDKTPSSFDWILVLDADEIWPKTSISRLVEFAQTNPQVESLVVRTHNLVGDIYHKLPESSGKYHLAGHSGHLNLRLMNLKQIPGLNVQKPHGQQGYYDKFGQVIQDRGEEKVRFVDVHYAHATHLLRSDTRSSDLKVPKRGQKFKYELGELIPDSHVPEVFFSQNRPTLVNDVTDRAPLSFWLISACLTPWRRLKRLLFPSGHGY